MTLEPTLSADTPADSAATRLGCTPVLFLLLVLVVGLVRLVSEVAEVLQPTDQYSDTVWTLGITALLAVILFWLRWRARTLRQRALYTTWLFALPLPVLLLPSTWFNPAESQWAALVQVGGLTLYALWVRWMVGGRNTRGTRPAALLAAVCAALLLLYPWLRWGAVGSWVDLGLALIAAAFFGWSAAQVIGRFWLRSLKVASAGLHSDLWVGGFVVSVTLLLMARNLGFNGGSLVLSLLLFPLGWLVMVISTLGLDNHRRATLNWPALALLLGLVSSYPLIFADTDTLSFLYLAQAEGGIWAFLAAFVSVLGILFLTLFFWLLRPWLQTQTAHWSMGAAAAGILLVGIWIYVAWGHPGLYGDALFVILSDQADVSAAASVEDYDERRRLVYHTLTEHATRTQADLRALLDRFGIDYRPYYLVNGVRVEGSIFVHLLLARHPAVDRIVPAPLLRPLPGPVVGIPGEEEGFVTPLWNLDAVNALRTWEELGVRGDGIVIGQSDTGVQWEHPALVAQYRGAAGDEVNHNYNWFDAWAHIPVPVDQVGHGTHTLGTALGEDLGVAPNAEWIACRNMGRNLGNAAFYLDCLQFMLAPFPLDGDPFVDGEPTLSAHITNNSWGCPEATEGCDPGTLRQAAEALRAAGIFTVVSAGNDGPACGSVDDVPAIYDAVFSVGAVDQSLDLAVFSSVGPVLVDGSNRTKPDITAPGVEILSSLPVDDYGFADGTSSAGPHVAGVVALMWSANPALIGNIEATEQILIETATPFTGTLATMDFALGEPCPLDTATVPNNLVGYGIVDAYAAVQRALNLRP